MSTNVSAVVLTLNEAENIIRTLDSAQACFDELVLVDGGSTDGTVYAAADWCEEHGKDIQVLKSSEREYLLEGPGTQRRRGANLAENDYAMALGADVEVEVHDPDWFEEEFNHWAYSHTRVRQSGIVERDWRMHHTDPPFDNAVRWRGMVHEELRTPDGEHVSDAYLCTEAPMVHHQRRDAAMDIKALQGEYPVTFDTDSGGNTSHALKKQHFLLAQAVSTGQERYLDEAWKSYYGDNKYLVLSHAEEIAAEFELPLYAHERYTEVEDVTPAAWWDEMKTGEPIMGFERDSLSDYIRKQLPI